MGNATKRELSNGKQRSTSSATKNSGIKNTMMRKTHIVVAAAAVAGKLQPQQLAADQGKPPMGWEKELTLQLQQQQQQ